MVQFICRMSAAALRAEPSHRSELVSQLLFGEKVDLMEQTSGWMLVKSIFDGYSGWVDAIQMEPCKSEPETGKLAVCHDLLTMITDEETGDRQWLTLGALVETSAQGRLNVGGRHFRYMGDVREFKEVKDPDLILASALKWLNAPYLWGGRTPLGVDCSGFVQLVYRSAGILLPRDAWQQAELGTDIPFATEAREADLAFFENSDGRIIHVGILNGEGHIVHASGKVRIDAFDHQGIFNRELHRYTHKLKMIRRII